MNLKRKSMPIKTTVRSGTDTRGGFLKIYEKDIFLKEGVEFEPLEAMLINSKSRVFRGIHYQKKYLQDRLITLIKGSLFVICLCVDSSREDFCNIISFFLEESGECLYIPENFAIGTLALEETIFSYMCGKNVYHEGYNCGINCRDESLNIDWPICFEEIIMSQQDCQWSGIESLRK